LRACAWVRLITPWAQQQAQMVRDYVLLAAARADIEVA